MFTISVLISCLYVSNCIFYYFCLFGFIFQKKIQDIVWANRAHGASGWFPKGDRVRSLIDSAPPLHLVKGDVGTVMGPGTSHECGQAGRLFVEFGVGKGKINIA